MLRCIQVQKYSVLPVSRLESRPCWGRHGYGSREASAQALRPLSAQLCFRNGCPGPDKPAASPHSHVQVRRRLQRPWRLLLCPLARRVAGCSSSPEDAALHEVQAAWSMPAWRELPVCAWAKRASQSLECRPWLWPARAPVASGPDSCGSLHGAQPTTNPAKQPHGLQGS